MTNPTPHPLAATIMEWAKDMQVDQSIVWRYKHPDSDLWMHSSNGVPIVFHLGWEYERVPKAERSREVVVNGERVMRGVWEALKYGETYFIPSILGDFFYTPCSWRDDKWDERRLSRGLVYRYNELHLAEAMARAMLKPLVGEGK